MTNTVMTRREFEKDKGEETHYCEFCDDWVEASYWSQFERPDNEPQGRVVWHCQRHREQGRLRAAMNDVLKVGFRL